MSRSDQPRFRPIQFSLKLLLLIVLVLAAFFAGQGSMQRLVDAERARADAARREMVDMKDRFQTLKVKADGFDELMRQQAERDRLLDQWEDEESRKRQDDVLGAPVSP